MAPWKPNFRASPSSPPPPVSKKPCIFGPSCKRVRRGTCLHYHEPGSSQRPESMTKGLLPSPGPPKFDIPCRDGPECEHFAKGTCYFHHKSGSLPESTTEGPPRPPSRPKSEIPCHLGEDCDWLKEEKCFYYHEPGTVSQRLQSMKKGLSGSVTLQAFGKVNPLQWYGICNVKMLAGFSVLEDGGLAVPGLPPMLNLPRSDIAFQKDDTHYSETPTRKTPKFEPLLRALEVLQPSVDPSEFALITTAGCLRRIAAFFAGHGRTERLDIEIRDDVLFVGRWEEDPMFEKNYGYGKQFEGAVTSKSPRLGSSVSSHLVAEYEMGGLRMGVQIEADSFDCECHSRSQSPPSPVSPGTEKRFSGGRFEALSDAPDGDATEDSGVLRIGTQLSLSCIVEIKTRKRDDDSTEPFLPQMYFQQTPRLLFGLRDGGLFRREAMRVYDEGEAVQAWGAENQVLLGKVVALLKRVVREAERRGEGCRMGLILGGKEGEAVLYERDAEELVSEV